MMAIEQSLKTHLFIELFFRQRDSLLVEQTYNSKERKLLFEAYGVFPCFEDIAKSIAYGLQQGRPGRKDRQRVYYKRF